MLGVTEIKHNEEQRSLEPGLHSSKALLDPNQNTHSRSIEVYNSEHAKGQETTRREQEEYFKSIEKHFQQRIKFMQKKLTTKKKKEMRNLKLPF